MNNVAQVTLVARLGVLGDMEVLGKLPRPAPTVGDPTPSATSAGGTYAR